MCRVPPLGGLRSNFLHNDPPLLSGNAPLSTTPKWKPPWHMQLSHHIACCAHVVLKDLLEGGRTSKLAVAALQAACEGKALIDLLLCMDGQIAHASIWPKFHAMSSCTLLLQSRLVPAGTLAIRANGVLPAPSPAPGCKLRLCGASSAERACSSLQRRASNRFQTP